ncbi:MAG TPA: hypothetical protein VJ890_12350 [Vineibacter sp.]|nr:hypothetical protein [Vineibacter sp.]
MAYLTETPKTLPTQGKFIHASDYRLHEARARKLRAEAVHATAKAISLAVRGWFARRAGTVSTRTA